MLPLVVLVPLSVCLTCPYPPDGSTTDVTVLGHLVSTWKRCVSTVPSLVRGPNEPPRPVHCDTGLRTCRLSFSAEA